MPPSGAERLVGVGDEIAASKIYVPVFHPAQPHVVRAPLRPRAAKRRRLELEPVHRLVGDDGGVVPEAIDGGHGDEAAEAIDVLDVGRILRARVPRDGDPVAHDVERPVVAERQIHGGDIGVGGAVDICEIDEEAAVTKDQRGLADAVLIRRSAVRDDRLRIAPQPLPSIC